MTEETEAPVAGMPAEEVKEDLTPKGPKKFFPGNINIAHEKGLYSGSDIKIFTEGEGIGRLDDQIKEFFAADPRLLVVDMKFYGSKVLVLYTNTLDDEEQAEFEAQGAYIHEMMDTWRQRREKSKQEQAETKRKAEAELKRLADVGRKCEANHGALIKQMRAIRKGKEVEALPAGLEAELNEEKTDAVRDEEAERGGAAEGSTPGSDN